MDFIWQRGQLVVSASAVCVLPSLHGEVLSCTRAIGSLRLEKTSQYQAGGRWGNPGGSGRWALTSGFKQPMLSWAFTRGGLCSVGVRPGAVGVFRETGSLPWCLHLESKRCTLLVLQLMEKVLLSSAAEGKCPGSPLQFQCNAVVLAYWEFPLVSCVWFDFEAGHDGLFSCFSLLVVSLCLSHRAFFLATLHARSFTFCEPKSRFLGGGVIRQLLISFLGWVACPGVGKNHISPHWLRSLPSFRGLHVRSVYRSESCSGSSGTKGTVRV